MGEAKNRGPLEARIETAIQAKDSRIEKLRKDLGIPERVEFCGYLVKVDTADQFLGAIDDGAYSFVTSPEQAFSYGVFDDAFELARPDQGEVVVALFDFGKKLIVANVTDLPKVV